MIKTWQIDFNLENKVQRKTYKVPKTLTINRSILTFIPSHLYQKIHKHIYIILKQSC